MSGSCKKLGLITYHSAYNFGSVLQALATQQKLLDLGHEVEVIDYRPAEGDRYYKALYRAYQGPKAFLADLTMLPVARLRRERARLFEKFIAENFLQDAKLVNNVRGIHGYTGFYENCRVSVMASGMGMPSIGIYSYELYNFFGVDNIIRIGSAGGMNTKVKVRDIVIALGASTNSSYANQYHLPG